jgi:UPF0271 protein
MRRAIDLNCDMGESYGVWIMGQDEAVMPLISSANIACGFHAGDPDVMRRTARLAREHNVAVGAHVSLPDRQGFGRREMRISPEELYSMTLYQIGALDAIARAEGSRLRHVKAHGALYHMVAHDEKMAEAMASAARDFDPRMLFFGLAGSRGLAVARAIGLRAVPEAFADRRYLSDGALAPRTQRDAVIEDADAAAAQVIAVVDKQAVIAIDGATVPVIAETMCLHGDRPDAAHVARVLHARLTQIGISVRAVDPEELA